MSSPALEHRCPLALAVALLFLAATTAAQTDSSRRSVELWEDGAPETQRVATELTVTERDDPRGLRNRFATGITEPTLTIFPASKPTGQAILIIPGGGYQRVVMDKEGYETAEWFQKRGVTSFVLMYRLPGETWTHRADVPLQDAQRALRWIRANANDFDISASRIGVMGFSAGGHLAASLATGYDRGVYAPVDAVDDYSARPDFAVLIYPVISMDPEITHAGSRERLIGSTPTADDVKHYSVERNAHAEMPPVFLLHAEDDDAVVVDNSLRLYDVLRAAGIAAELHLYSVGGHGFGMRNSTDKPVAEWPKLVERWLVELD